MDSIQDDDLAKMIPGAYATASFDNGTLRGEQYKAIEDAKNNPRKIKTSSFS